MVGNDSSMYTCTVHQRRTTIIENTLEHRMLPKGQLPILRSMVFPIGANYLYKKRLKDPANINRCIEYYFAIL